MMSARSIAILFFTFIAGLSAIACGNGPSANRTIIASTEARTNGSKSVAPTSNDKTPTAPDSPLASLLAKDERRAAEILKQSACGAGAPEAAWAAVYALRLGIKHDGACAIRALMSGITADDVLLKALSWRWAATLPSMALPDWQANASDDPVVRIMAALAFSRRGTVPEALQTALRLPSGDPRAPDPKEDDFRDREAMIRWLAEPYDDGPLASAVAFVEARFAEAVELKPDSAPAWTCARLKADLLRQLAINDEVAVESEESYLTGLSRVSERLENALIARPGSMLRNIAVTGSENLREESLRAIALVAREPVTGDFAAAAAALAAENPKLRIEGARTFLLLVLRAQP